MGPHWAPGSYDAIQNSRNKHFKEILLPPSAVQKLDPHQICYHIPDYTVSPPRILCRLETIQPYKFEIQFLTAVNTLSRQEVTPAPEGVFQTTASHSGCFTAAIQWVCPTVDTEWYCSQKRQKPRMIKIRKQYTSNTSICYASWLHVSTPIGSSSGFFIESCHKNAAYIIGIPVNVTKYEMIACLTNHR